MTEKIGSLVIDIAGQTLTSEDGALLAHPQVGGVILFSRNYESFDQLRRLCNSIRAACTHPLLIMVDQEGGRVQRFTQDFTRLPHMGQFGEIYDHNPDAACYLAKDCGWLMAVELLSAGVDLSLAPVLDLNKGMSEVIGMRAFHTKPKAVIALAQAFIAGMSEAGMAATGKHFPGHGSVAVDSHVGIPIDNRSLEEILDLDLLPFAKLIETSLTAIMTAHIIFPKVDTLPVGYSSVWLNDILRGRLGFKGPIFSDDLNMAGANISTNYVDRFISSKKAGCDFVLLCNNRPAVLSILEELDDDAFLVSQEKSNLLQGNFSYKKNTLQDDQRWLKTRENLRNHLAIQL